MLFYVLCDLSALICIFYPDMHLFFRSVFMDEAAVKIENGHKEKPRSAKPSLTGFFSLIGRLLFYRPVWTESNQQLQDIRFIYVHFSAWHFAGSDMLWAGLAIRLFQAMQINFGKLQLALYRVAQHDEEDEFKKKVCESSYLCILRPKNLQPQLSANVCMLTCSQRSLLK